MIRIKLSSQPRRAAVHIVPLAQETRAALPTSEAAAHLSRSPQTLRAWAAYDIGPVRAIRVNGRLAWPVADLMRALGVAQ